MSVMDTLTKIIGGARSAVASLKVGESGIRERLAALDAEQARLLSALAPRAEVEANLAQLVAELGRAWIADHGPSIVRAASGRVVPGDGLTPPTEVQPPTLGETSAGPWPLTVASAAAFWPDQLLAGLRRLVQATPYEPGPPMAERLARLAAIAEERRAEQARHAGLVDEAAAAGLTLEHLPEERGRRWQVAREHKAWQRDVAVNREYYDHHPRPPEPPRPIEPTEEGK